MGPRTSALSRVRSPACQRTSAAPVAARLKAAVPLSPAVLNYPVEACLALAHLPHGDIPGNSCVAERESALQNHRRNARSILHPPAGAAAARGLLFRLLDQPLRRSPDCWIEHQHADVAPITSRTRFACTHHPVALILFAAPVICVCVPFRLSQPLPPTRKRLPV